MPKISGTGVIVGDDVGFVGFAVGEGEGLAVGMDVGRLVGNDDGRLVEGLDEGGDVSPGFVGRVVIGAFVGEEVGTLLVGIDVGADTNITGATIILI